jgi:formylglycine-generating enzyme
VSRLRHGLPSSLARRALALGACGLGVLAVAAPRAVDARGPGCPAGMALIPAGGAVTHAYCIDRWEASVVERRGRGSVAHSPFHPVAGLSVRAVSRPGVVPQAYISKNEAEAACAAAGKRLCSGAEWERACRGKKPTTFPYGDDRKTGYCNDAGKAPLLTVHPELGEAAYASSVAMNDPKLNQLPGTVAPTGSFKRCKNSFGVHDMVGNVHEWVSDVAGSRGTFRGGYYLDTHKNGDGCGYRTVAHDVSYHDYSTGFRCCAKAR